VSYARSSVLFPKEKGLLPLSPFVESCAWWSSRVFCTTPPPSTLPSHLSLFLHISLLFLFFFFLPVAKRNCVFSYSPRDFTPPLKHTFFGLRIFAISLWLLSTIPYSFLSFLRTLLRKPLSLSPPSQQAEGPLDVGPRPRSRVLPLLGLLAKKPLSPCLYSPTPAPRTRVGAVPFSPPPTMLIKECVEDDISLHILLPRLDLRSKCEFVASLSPFLFQKKFPSEFLPFFPSPLVFLPSFLSVEGTPRPSFFPLLATALATVKDFPFLSFFLFLKSPECLGKEVFFFFCFPFGQRFQKTFPPPLFGC